MAAVNVYRAIMLECERQRAALGIGMEKFSEYAGLPDRYYGKALHMDTPSGKQANWPTLQIMIDALFPHGFDLIIRPKPGQVVNAENLKAKLLQIKALKDPKSQRELMSEIGARGGRKSGEARRAAAQRRNHLSLAGKRGAAIRWKKRKGAVPAE